MSLLLIDGDIVAHRVAWTCERTRYLIEDGKGFNLEFIDDYKTAQQRLKERPTVIWSRKEVEPEEKAIVICNQVMKDILERYPDKEPRVFLSPSVGNFRDQLATRAKYKGNRDGAQRPAHLSAVRDHLTTKWHAALAEGQEADDCLGIYATNHPGSVIVSIDKDLMQIPGLHYNWTTKEEVSIDKKQADMNFFIQCLTGDKTDNIPGIAGVGPVTAGKILEGSKSRKDCWKRIVDRYIEEYQDRGLMHALETASLVWIRRKVGENFQCP